MRLKFIFVLIILSFYGTLLFADEESTPAKTNSWAYEFSIGGGLKRAFSYSLLNVSLNEYSYSGRICDFNAGIILQISFIYYLNNNFGIGFIYKFAYIALGYMPSANYISSGMSFDNYLNMFNKIFVPKFVIF
jgi:hypothetical protein